MFTVELDDVASDPIVAAIEQRRREVHPCIVPGCNRLARQHFWVNRRTRLAGRDWRAGDLIDLCPAHAHELRAAASKAVVEGEAAITPLREWAS